MINFCKLTKSTCPYHSMATYIALASPKDPYTSPLFALAMVVHSPDSGFSSISITSSSESSIGITHTASESAVQLQQQRLVPHKQPFSSWADGVARHTGATSAHPRKHHPCANPMQQRAAPQPQAQAQESTAGHIVGGSTNKIHAPQQDRNTGSSSQAHTHTIALLCILRYRLVLLWVFPLTSKKV